MKSNRRTSLHTSTLDDLLEISIEGPPLEEFSPMSAVELWWSSCKTKTHKPAKEETVPATNDRIASTPSSKSDDSGSQKVEPTFALQDWDDWFASKDDTANSE